MPGLLVSAYSNNMRARTGTKDVIKFGDGATVGSRALNFLNCPVENLQKSKRPKETVTGIPAGTRATGCSRAGRAEGARQDPSALYKKTLLTPQIEGLLNNPPSSLT